VGCEGKKQYSVSFWSSRVLSSIIFSVCSAAGFEAWEAVSIFFKELVFERYNCLWKNSFVEQVLIKYSKHTLLCNKVSEYIDEEKEYQKTNDAPEPFLLCLLKVII